VPPSQSHARLEALREGLLALHKTLLAIARAEYESAHGPVGGPGALLHLLINDPAFAWLHPVSELAARADELLEEDELPDVEATALERTAAELLVPDENGAGFARKYFEALQAEPDVVMAHAELRKLLRKYEPKPSA